MITAKIAQLWFKPMSLVSKFCVFLPHLLEGTWKKILWHIPSPRATVLWANTGIGTHIELGSRLGSNLHCAIYWCLGEGNVCFHFSSPRQWTHPAPRDQAPYAHATAAPGVRETECGSLGLGGDCPNVPFSSLRKLLFSLRLPSKLPFLVEDILHKLPKWS